MGGFFCGRVGGRDEDWGSRRGVGNVEMTARASGPLSLGAWGWNVGRCRSVGIGRVACLSSHDATAYLHLYVNTALTGFALSNLYRCPLNAAPTSPCIPLVYVGPTIRASASPKRRRLGVPTFTVIPSIPATVGTPNRRTPPPTHPKSLPEKILPYLLTNSKWICTITLYHYIMI